MVGDTIPSQIHQHHGPTCNYCHSTIIVLLALAVQLMQFKCPMTPRQLEYLDSVHRPVIAKYKPTQRHFDLMVAYLTESLQAYGAEVRGSSKAAAAARMAAMAARMAMAVSGSSSGDTGGSRYERSCRFRSTWLHTTGTCT